MFMLKISDSDLLCIATFPSSFQRASLIFPHGFSSFQRATSHSDIFQGVWQCDAMQNETLLY
jgi:hypothetical protein